jgi:broad specificity phosphatase PhoE
MADRLVLIRHGESNAQVERLVLGHACTGLSPVGVTQAQALRDRLAQTAELADAVSLSTSLMERAAQTAVIVAPAVGNGALPLRADCAFCEQHHGTGDGLSWDDYDARYGGFDNFVERSRVGPADGESIERLVARTGLALRRLADPYEPGMAVVIAHGETVGTALEV